MGSHSTGIGVSTDLTHSFADAHRNGSKRLIKVQIVEDELRETDSGSPSGDFLSDLSFVEKYLEKSSPCYILFRTDETSTSGYNWIFMCYVPDLAKVKEKMVYAGSRANLKLGIGASNFVEDIFGTVPGDFNREGYEAFKTHQQTDAPMTASEIQIREEKEQGVFVGGGGSSTAYMHGVAFPFLDECTEKIQEFINSQINYLQIAIDVEKEFIYCSESGNISVEEVPDHVPIDIPRFHFFRWTHDFEGETISTSIFIYSCPDGSCGTKSSPVKQRMLYSSSKANVSDGLESKGLQIDKKFEINAPSEISEEIIFKEVHPQEEIKKQAFSRPSRPGKGPRRLIKDPK